MGQEQTKNKECWINTSWIYQLTKCVANSNLIIDKQKIKESGYTIVIQLVSICLFLRGNVRKLSRLPCVKLIKGLILRVKIEDDRRCSRVVIRMANV